MLRHLVPLEFLLLQELRRLRLGNDMRSESAFPTFLLGDFLTDRGEMLGPLCIPVYLQPYQLLCRSSMVLDTM